MTPAFSSWQDFWHMSGYAFYVWLAVSISFLALSCLVIHTLLGRKRLLAEIKRQKIREQRIHQAKQVNKEGSN